jgi:Rab GDP dissociation inhibitor
MYEPIMDGRTDGLFISKSYDATSHFESVCEDVKDLYERYAGKPLSLKKRSTQEVEQEELTKSFSKSSIADV